MIGTSRKYCLIPEDTIYLGILPLYGIRALRDFGTVKAGDLGGYIQGTSCLSHEGDCWVGDTAKVFLNAIVCGDAQVYGEAQISNCAVVGGNAHVFGNANVQGMYARVYGNAKVFGNACVIGAEIYGDAQVDAHIVWPYFINHGRLTTWVNHPQSFSVLQPAT